MSDFPFYAFNGSTTTNSQNVNRINWLLGCHHTSIIEMVQQIVKDGLHISGLLAGNGAIAKNASVEKAVRWAIKKATSNYITYSQSNRNLKNPDGYSYDCSSFIITAFYVGGFDVNATYTGNMRSGFTALGFTWIPGSYWTSSELVRGDILLDEVNHTQMYIGGNQDVNCGSTPACVQRHENDNYGRGWDGILRYEK